MERKNLMKRSVFAVLALALLCAGPVMAQAPAGEAAAKKQDIRKLLDLTGAAQIGQQIAAQMIPMFKQSNPQVPQKFWDDVQKEFNPEAMIQLIIPIYEKHLTHDDVRGLIAFYQSPLGRKMTAVTPQITQESMAAGQQWGMQIAQRVQKRLQDQQKGGAKGK
jgi:hypothetical protein